MLYRSLSYTKALFGLKISQGSQQITQWHLFTKRISSNVSSVWPQALKLEHFTVRRKFCLHAAVYINSSE